MHMDLFNVVERGTSRVYRLTYAPEGLYLIYMTHIEGQEDYAGGTAKLQSKKQHSIEPMESYAGGEEELSGQMSEDMLEHEHSRYLPWNQIQDASTGPDDHELRLQTTDGLIELDLRNSPPDNVARFVDLVREAVKLEQQGRREMRRE